MSDMLVALVLSAAWAHAPRQACDPEAIREQLGRILSRSEFREKMPSDFWRKLRDYLKLKALPEPDRRGDAWPSCSAGGHSGGFPRGLMVVVFIACMALVAALIVAVLYRMWVGRARATPPPAFAPPAGEGTLNPLSRDSRDWARQAEDLYRQGRLAEAVRALYLAVLAVAHLRNWIEYHPSKTNWEYVRSFAGPPEGRAGLGGLTRTFEILWFGRRLCTREDYLESRRLAGELLGFKEGAA